MRRDGVVKVLDFGIARPLRAAFDAPASQRTAPAEVGTDTWARESGLMGTPRYMAPEQLLGAPLDARADQFAWGVMAHELLTGRSPFPEAPGVSLTLVQAIVDDTPVRLGAAAARLLAAGGRRGATDLVEEARRPLSFDVRAGPRVGRSRIERPGGRASDRSRDDRLDHRSDGQHPAPSSAAAEKPWSADCDRGRPRGGRPARCRRSSAMGDAGAELAPRRVAVDATSAFGPVAARDQPAPPHGRRRVRGVSLAHSRRGERGLRRRVGQRRARRDAVAAGRQRPRDHAPAWVGSRARPVARRAARGVHPQRRQGASDLRRRFSMASRRRATLPTEAPCRPSLRTGRRSGPAARSTPPGSTSPPAPRPDRSTRRPTARTRISASCLTAGSWPPTPPPTSRQTAASRSSRRTAR